MKLCMYQIPFIKLTIPFPSSHSQFSVFSSGITRQQATSHSRYLFICPFQVTNRLAKLYFKFASQPLSTQQRSRKIPRNTCLEALTDYTPSNKPFVLVAQYKFTTNLDLFPVVLVYYNELTTNVMLT